MSQENVEVVRAAYDAWHRDGIDAMLEFWADDVDHRSVDGSPDDHGPIQGKDALRAFLEEWTEMFEGFKVEAVELIDAGEDTVIMAQRISGRARISGVETEMEQAMLLRVREGLIAVGREYSTREQALEAAGLQE
jgi:ketosteroid isomerase-like protein